MKLLRYLCAINKQRTVVIYRNYFTEFYVAQSEKVQHKIAKTIEIIESIDRIPERYLKYLQNGLFEMRVQLGSDIFRVFCFFDGGKLVILHSGFQKKTQKTPKGELERAMRLMKEYFKEKEEEK
jgi:phage-related protein